MPERQESDSETESASTGDSVVLYGDPYWGSRIGEDLPQRLIRPEADESRPSARDRPADEMAKLASILGLLLGFRV